MLISYRCHSAALLSNAINTQFSFIDVWREQHKDEHNPTWTGRGPRDPSLFIQMCINFFMYEPEVTLNYKMILCMSCHVFADPNVENMKRAV